jgi:uncharacterized protein (TIGR02391 family)
MTTLVNNPVIKQLRILFGSAINLKMLFDIKDYDSIPEGLEAYLNELDKLSKICPSDVISKSNLLRHSGWMQKRVNEGNPNYCYGDIQDVCQTDIFAVEEFYLQYLTSTKEAADKFYDWQNIHPVIQQISRSRFETFHFADAVEACFKEINDIIKKQYHKIVGKEEDGDSLMRKSFTSTTNNNFNPIFKLADNATESGRNIQQGYMDIFAGSIKGIRNPKTHANLNIDPDESWEMIVLASHLMRMWEKFN